MEYKLQIAVAKALKATRTDKALSQEELAHICDLDRTYISGIERQIRNPTVKTLARILTSLKITEQDFLLRVISELNND